MAESGLRGHAVVMRTPPLAGPSVRVGLGLLLCAACFQSGRWYQELSARAEEPEPAAAETVAAEFVGPLTPALPAVPAATAAPGDPEGHNGDIITPLNVRDPSALVMGPAHYYQSCPPPEPAPQAVPMDSAKEAKPRKLKEGRLLELLKKADKNSGAPKRY